VVGIARVVKEEDTGETPQVQPIEDTEEPAEETQEPTEDSEETTSDGQDPTES
jgi:hypothetical protein